MRIGSLQRMSLARASNIFGKCYRTAEMYAYNRNILNNCKIKNIFGNDPNFEKEQVIFSVSLENHNAITKSAE